MGLRTVSDVRASSHLRCERLLAELADDISELDIGRRKSETLSTCVHTLESALTTTRRLHSANLEILDYLAFGTGVLGVDGQLLQSNRYLREVLETGDGLHLSRGRLSAQRPQETEEIRTRIAEVAAGSRADVPAKAIRVSRTSADAALLVMVAPVKEKALKISGSVALVFVDDPSRSVPIEPSLVQSLFGFTRTESKIAAQLAGGARLDTIADSLAIATSTARSHLKHIFDKTRTERQADLTALVRSLLGSLRI